MDIEGVYKFYSSKKSPYLGLKVDSSHPVAHISDSCVLYVWYCPT